jgi:hypothetical protein
VVVSDFHYNVNDLVPWIEPGHPLYGLGVEEIYLYLFGRYLKVKPWIALPESSSRYRLGEEVLVDALLAARCESFLGNGLSNVSCAVGQMKKWPAARLRLFGARIDRLHQLTLYRN